MKNFWQGKRVLVTGHTGFKGPWLCLFLSHLGARVTGFALKPEKNQKAFSLLKVNKNIQSKFGNITELSAVKRIVRNSNPEIIIHLAAQSLVQRSYQNPVETFATNLMGTVNILEAARHSKNLKACLIVTSDKCYEDQNTKQPYEELSKLGGRDPYSASKACEELIAHSYRTTFFKNSVVATARSGNVIGGGDFSTARLVPDLVKALSCKEKALIHNPKSIRPWMHVLDPLSGYLDLCQKLYQSKENLYASPWNFGPDQRDEFNVGELAKLFYKTWGQGEIKTAKELAETRRLRLDSKKSCQKLGWKPKLSVQEATQWTVDWYRAHQNGEDMESTTLKQIAAYLDL